MRSLRELQSAFLAFLADGDEACQDYVVDDRRVGRDRRLAIYGNAYRMRLKEAIETDHAMLGVYLGDELFDRMVAGYVRAHPSRYRSLRHYADALPEYLAATAPFDAHPQVAELAAFERLMLHAFDAPDADRRRVEDLLALSAGAWPSMRVRFHPSCQLFRPRWSAVEIWKALKAGEVPDAPHPVAHAWSVWRGVDRLTQFVPLEPDELAMLDAMMRGADFAAVCEDLLCWHDQTEASSAAVSYLSGWVSQGLVTAIIAPGGRLPDNRRTGQGSAQTGPSPISP